VVSEKMRRRFGKKYLSARQKKWGRRGVEAPEKKKILREKKHSQIIKKLQREKPLYGGEDNLGEIRKTRERQKPKYS